MANNRKWWAIGGVGCLVLGLILTIAVVFAILSFVRTALGPKQTAEKFCSSLKHNDYRKAWDLLTPQIQEKYGTHSDFKRFFKNREPVTWRVESSQVTDHKATIEITVTSKSTGWEALVHHRNRFFLKEIKGKWKIDKIEGSWMPRRQKPKPIV